MNICICFQFTYLTSGDSHVPCPWQLFPADTLLFPLPSSRVCNQRLGDHTILFSPVLLSFIYVCFDCTAFSQCGGRVSMHWIADKCVSNTCVIFWFVIGTNYRQDLTSHDEVLCDGARTISTALYIWISGADLTQSPLKVIQSCAIFSF